MQGQTESFMGRPNPSQSIFSGSGTVGMMSGGGGMSPAGTTLSAAGISGGIDDASKRSIKLASTVPEQQRGERPYYHECYYKYCTSILAMREAVLVTEDIVKASSGFYERLASIHARDGVAAPTEEGSPPFGLTFSWNALMQADARTSLLMSRNASSWDERSHLFRKFQESIAPSCEQAVFASQRLFKGRAGHHVPLDLVAIENTTSFISTTFGALIHVWHSTTEAKKFIQSQCTVANALAALRLPALAVPFTVSFTMHTFTVTATALVPLAPTPKKLTTDGPQLQRQLKQLELWCRAKRSFSAVPGADGQWYVVDTLNVLRAEAESQGETNNMARPYIFDAFPNMDDFPDTLRKAAKRMLDLAVQGILDGVTDYATSVGGITGAKVHDLVMARIVPKACHAVGVKICHLYDMLEHPKLFVPADGQPTSPIVVAARELVCAEMVCRTFKELVRAEVSCIKTVPHIEAPVPAVSQFIVEIANRCVFNLLTKDDLWALHVMAVLRIKFNTPEAFMLSHTLTKRCVLGYITSRLGLVFEGGRYCRCSTVMGGNSSATSSSDVQLLLQGKSQEAVTLSQTEWKKAIGIANPDLMMVAARRQLMMFAQVGVADEVEQCMVYLDGKMEDRSCDLATRGDMLFAYLTALKELVPHPKANTLCRRLCTEYIKKYAKQFAAKDCDVPIALNRILSIIDVIPMLSTTTTGGGTLGTESSFTSASSFSNGSNAVEVECSELRLMALELFRRIVIHASSSVDGGDHQEGGWMHPLLLQDSHCGMLCGVLDQTYSKEGNGNTCSFIVSQLLQSRSSRSRYEFLCNRLQRSGVSAVSNRQLVSTLPPPLKSLYRDTAMRVYEMCVATHTESSLPAFGALLVYAAQQGLMEALSMRQSADVNNFLNAVVPLLSKLAFDTKPLPPLDEQPQHEAWQSLRSEAALTAVSDMTVVLMDTTHWNIVKRLVAYTHHVVCEGRVDGYARLTQAAHPCLEELARMMRAAMRAVDKFQYYAKRSMDQKKDDRIRVIEARNKRENGGYNKMSLSGKPEVPLALLLHAAKECLEVSLRLDVRATPHIRALSGAFHASTLTGLRTLLAAAPPKSFGNLATIAVQSGFFPPFKFATLPFLHGHRHVVIVPDTQCLGLYWSRLWLSPTAKYFESTVPLYAKVAAQYIANQVRFSHLFYSVVGLGMAGPIAECLMQLIAAADGQVLITLGSPATFSNPKGLPATCIAAHVALEDDLTPHLLGCVAMPHLRARYIARLEGLGVMLPFPPTKRQLQSVALYHRYVGGFQNVVVIRERGAHKELVPMDVFPKQLDLRRQFVGLAAQHYVEALTAFAKTPIGSEQLRAEGGPISPVHSMFTTVLAAAQQADKQGRMNPALPSSTHRMWFPPDVAVLQQELSPDGAPSDKLKSSMSIPSSVEPNVIHHELMTLMYPKIVQRILKGVLVLNDDYGFDSDGQGGITAVERILKCRTMDQLVYVLQSYVAASWNSECLAMQLCEWSGVEQGLHRQPLLRHVVEAVLSKHTFLFTMCPDTAKSSENGTVVDKLTKHLSEDAKAIFSGPFGYHVGWSVALCRTLTSVDISGVLQSLQSASCQVNGIADVHPRTGKNLFAPAIRFSWTPPPSKAMNNSRTTAASPTTATSSSTAAGKPGSSWALVQWNLLELTFDGSNASQALMRSAEQCIWVVQDDYSFQHFMDTVDVSGSDGIRQYLIYTPIRALTSSSDDNPNPPGSTDESAPITAAAGAPPTAAAIMTTTTSAAGKGSTLHGLKSSSQQQPAAPLPPGANPQLIARIKTFADSHSVPFMEFYPSHTDAAGALMCLLMREVAGLIRVPINPGMIPRKAHVGGLYSHDEEEIGRMVRKGLSNFVKPTTPPNMRSEDAAAVRRGPGGGGAPVLSLQPGNKEKRSGRGRAE